MFKKLKALFGNAGAQANHSASTEHAVLVHFDYGQDDLTDLHSIEDALREKVEKAAAGELDGHEIAMDGSHGRLYFYGPDADILFNTIKPVLKSATCIKNPRIVLRYGPASDPSAPEFEADLNSR